MTTHSSPPVTRVVLLGASNLTISFPLIVRRLRSGLPGRLETFAALGWGRSFGNWSRVLFRGLPGTVGCGLWSDLPTPEASATELGLITDVGNDLLYGYPVPQIVQWLETCLARLAERQARLVLTLIPLGSIEQLSPWRFRLVRKLLYPKNRMSFDQLLELSRELNERLIELGPRFGAHTVVPPPEWYGFDPIHVLRRHRAAAWERILSGWNVLAPPDPERTRTGWTASRLRRLRPEVRTLFGRVQRRPQPALALPDGAVWIY
ncbi:MAG TPA: hypothetical protein VML55_21010 [Planctomycetaceae bacterium]|nr:hypothetical protein [Planctomycetaceae bacterium]